MCVRDGLQWDISTAFPSKSCFQHKTHANSPSLPTGSSTSVFTRKSPATSAAVSSSSNSGNNGQSSSSQGSLFSGSGTRLRTSGPQSFMVAFGPHHSSTAARNSCCSQNMAALMHSLGVRARTINRSCDLSLAFVTREVITGPTSILGPKYLPSTRVSSGNMQPLCPGI